MSQIFAIVLAAGQGKRMRSHIPKVAHMLLKKTLLQWTIDAVLHAGLSNIMVVISKSKLLEDIISTHYSKQNVLFCYQDTPLGTAHAVQCGLHAVELKTGEASAAIDTILVAYGDTPAVKSGTYAKFIQFHKQEKNAISILAFYAKNPFGYGRIVTDEHNQFLAIREEKDCSEQEKNISLCHSGLMCANFDVLRKILPQIESQNQASEFYLTDVIAVAKNLGHKVGFMTSNHENEFAGVNTPEQLISMESELCAV